MSKLLEALADKEELEKSNIFEQYLISKAFERGIPLKGTFELTPKCTLNCSMCYVHLQNSQMHREELTTAEWISLIDQAIDMGMMYATLTGGECFLYPGFKEIYEHLRSKGILVTVLTNGTLLDEETVTWLADRSPQKVQISVYGSDYTGYQRVTGNGDAFYHVDKAIDLLKQANIPFDIAVTLSKQMIPDFKNIIQYCFSKKPEIPKVNSCPFEARSETERQFESFAPSLDEQVDMLKTLIHLVKERERPDCSQVGKCQQEEENTGFSLPERGIICAAGRYGFSITWEGKMTPCSTFNCFGKFPLIEGFQKSWQDLNNICRNYKNPVECIDCEFLKACRFCPAGHYMKAGEGHANPDVCAEGKRMVKEGVRVL